MLVISNQPHAIRLADLKLLTKLLPELYSSQSYYHNLSQKHGKWDVFVEYYCPSIEKAIR